jgi:cytoskeletal protein CcmA (bactofilin family)
MVLQENSVRKENIQINGDIMGQVRAVVVTTGYRKGDIKAYIEAAILEKLANDGKQKPTAEPQ